MEGHYDSLLSLCHEASGGQIDSAEIVMIYALEEDSAESAGENGTQRDCLS